MDAKKEKKKKVWSAEVFELKKVMDAKLKCQELYGHRIEEDKWMINVAQHRYFQPRGERDIEPKWVICNKCNK